MTPRDFTLEQTALLSWAVRDVISRRRLDGRASWSTMRALEGLHRQLATSADGSESNTAAEESETEDLVDTTAAAEILECSTRWVREIRADLDGKQVGRRWIFPRRSVVEYAAAKGFSDDGDRIPRTGGGAVPPRAA
jgi:hypothetical protein